MNKLSAFALAAGLTLLLPVQAQSQGNPALIGQGAQVYSTTCARCHNVRPSSERTDREWMAIVAHMRARANMSKSHAAAVLAFLQATNLPETGAGMASAAGVTNRLRSLLGCYLEHLMFDLGFSKFFKVICANSSHKIISG